MAYVLGVDVGGTSIKAGLFSEGGQLLAVSKVPTGSLVSEAAFAQVTEGLKKLVHNNGGDPEDVVAVGLDVPGPVDDKGDVGLLPNVMLDPTGLKAALLRAFPEARLAFVNDANAAALGELWQGTARGTKSMVLVALGTGVGGGIVCDGKLVAGAFGAGGEIGHITVNRDETLVCGCGRCGCLEQYASAKGIVRIYKEECEFENQEPVKLDGPTDTLSVFNAAREGDKAAEAAIAQMTDYLGFALSIISTVIDPELYLIGGGVGEGFDFFGDQLRASFHEHCFAPSASARILPASLGNQAAMYGSAYQALQA